MFIVKYDHKPEDGPVALGLEEEYLTLEEAQAAREDIKADDNCSNIQIIDTEVD